MKAMVLKSPFLFFLFLLSFSLHVKALVLEVEGTTNEEAWNVGSLVRKDQRRSLVQTEYGEISAVKVSDGTKSGRYHLQFFTLEPNALFLPVLLHADMVLYVKTGSGRLYWSPGDEEVMTVSLQRGDIYRVPPGSIFFLKSDLQPEREKLRIHAIFANSDNELRATDIGAYSSIAEMVRGFDKNILLAAFKASEEVIEAITSSSTPAIVHMAPSPKLVHLLDWEISFLKAFGGARAYIESFENKKKKKETKTFNVLKEHPDFNNCNGWSSTVTKSDLPSLKNSNIGVFYVNLTKGSMMGPHWNPKASEIAIVVEGQGMVRVVCASSTNESGCKNMRFRVNEGDVFAVPRFRPMAQMSFNNDSLVMVGFSTTTKKNYPQFLAGKASVLQVLDKDVLATALRVSNTTISELLAPQGDSVILDCTSCAEEEEMKMEEEIEKEEEEKRREEEKEEVRKREEKEAKRREEEQKEREEEEVRKREEEEREREREREKEEARKREEEERERERREREEEEEEREKEREEEEAKKREEEREREMKEREEEKEREKEREEEEAKKREEQEEEEEARSREEESEREQQKEKEREQKEEEKRRQEEEARKREEEEERKEKKPESEEDEARRQEKERSRREQQEEEDMKRKREKQEEEARREEGGGGGGEGEGEGGKFLKKIWRV